MSYVGLKPVSKLPTIPGPKPVLKQPTIPGPSDPIVFFSCSARFLSYVSLAVGAPLVSLGQSCYLLIVQFYLFQLSKKGPGQN